MSESTSLSVLRVALPFGVGTPEAKRHNYRDALRLARIEAVETAGALDGLDGLLLAGGTDVDPALYGEERQAGTDEPDWVRDALEIRLLGEALERDLPVLGICRGIQLLNVAMGGALRQHIEGHKRPKEPDVHPVRIESGSLLETILGGGDYVVNSRHHQCAGRIAAPLRVAARAPDGVVEALEVPGRRFVLAVQWHPEARTFGPDLRLFEAFARAMRR